MAQSAAHSRLRPQDRVALGNRAPVLPPNMGQAARERSASAPSGRVPGNLSSIPTVGWAPARPAEPPLTRANAARVTAAFAGRSWSQYHVSAPKSLPPQHLQPVLSQLLTGATDVAASKRLGMSPRTFSRRVSELLDYLGVSTRFQAGVASVDRGWVMTTDDRSAPSQG